MPQLPPVEVFELGQQFDDLTALATVAGMVRLAAPLGPQAVMACKSMPCGKPS